MSVTNIEMLFTQDTVTAKMTALELLFSGAGMTGFLSGVVGPYLAKRAEARFANEGDDVVGQWAELKPATQQIRSQGPWTVGGAHPINKRTGELEDWVVRGGWKAAPTSFGASMVFPGRTPAGELFDKVETAQKGRTSPSTVARPVVGVNATDLVFVVAALSMAVEAIG